MSPSPTSASLAPATPGQTGTTTSSPRSHKPTVSSHSHSHSHPQATTRPQPARKPANGNTLASIVQSIGIALLQAAEFSLYSAVPLYYVAHLSPIRDLIWLPAPAPPAHGPFVLARWEPTSTSQIMAYTAAMWAVYLSAVVVVSWLHHRELRRRLLRDMTALVGVAGGLHYLFGGMARFAQRAVVAG